MSQLICLRRAVMTKVFVFQAVYDIKGCISHSVITNMAHVPFLHCDTPKTGQTYYRATISFQNESYMIQPYIRDSCHTAYVSVLTGNERNAKGKLSHRKRQAFTKQKVSFCRPKAYLSFYHKPQST